MNENSVDSPDGRRPLYTSNSWLFWCLDPFNGSFPAARPKSTTPARRPLPLSAEKVGDHSINSIHPSILGSDTPRWGNNEHLELFKAISRLLYTECVADGICAADGDLSGWL